MAEGRDRTPDDPKVVRRTRAAHEIANQNRLVALGEAIDERSGVKGKPPRVRRHRRRRAIAVAGIAFVVLVAAVAGASYLYANWRFDQIRKIQVNGEVKAVPGQPFNVLMIGSDSRAGLSGLVARQTGASTGQVAGQRSDVVKIVHIDAKAGTISKLSIPRDTMVTLLANQSLYGQFNRINVNFRNGPSLLAQTITANLGIPIHDTIVVSFAGLINAADALGGVYLDFPFPSKDPYSGLRISHPGCQNISGFEALAVTRSRHFYWFQNGAWNYDGSSDFGRIDRQNAFLRAMVDRAKTLINPLTVNSFLSKLPQGITLDNNFSLNQLIGLALRFRSFNTNALRTYTLPTIAATTPNLGDVLFIQQPEAQRLLVKIFGAQLETPTNPPPNQALQTPPPPKVVASTPTTTPLTTTASKQKRPTAGATAIPNPTIAVPYFDPVPCAP